MSKVKKGIKKFAQKKAKGQVQFKKKHHHGHKRSGGELHPLQQQQRQEPEQYCGVLRLQQIHSCSGCGVQRLLTNLFTHVDGRAAAPVQLAAP